MGRISDDFCENQSGEPDAIAFQKIKNNKVCLPELVMEKIMDAIRAEHIQIGNSLPPERKLAKDLGVSRNVIRDCLSIMDYLGITKKQNQRRVLVRSSEYFEKICALIEHNKV